MAVTGTQNVRDIVEAAMRKAGILDVRENAAAEDMTLGIGELFRMLKAWQGCGALFIRAEQTVTLTTAASYALAAPARPLRVLTARLVRGGIETPMQRMTRDEYDSLPLKTSTGLPTTFHFDRQREQATLFVWPVLAAAAGETIKLTIDREIEDVTDPNDTLDIPAEWYEAAVYGLALRLADTYGLRDEATRRVALRAERAWKDAKAFGNDESVLFGIEGSW